MEEWKVIAGYDDYMVSSLGRIKSTRRNVEKILACAPNADGYRVCNIYNGERGSCRKTVTVARVVAEAFLPNPGNKPTVDHINRCRSDNRVCNLRWATHSEQNVNTRDRKHSTAYRNICVRYTVKIVRDGKDMCKSFSTLDEAVNWRDKMLPHNI